MRADDGAAAIEPVVAAASVRRFPLPVPTTTFFDRAEEVALLAGLLRDPSCRLLTLTGTGGVGKTRLAIEVAREVRGLFADDVLFVDLQPVPSAELVAAAIAEAAGLRLQGQRSPRDQLVRFLQQSERLIVLDNIEHVIESGDLVAEILREAPAVKLLVTSREVLGLAEQVYRVEPLPLAEEGGGTLDGPATRLFIDRARRVRHDFDPDAEPEAIAGICRLVDGVPLAIELAAAWTGALSCAQIAAEIGRTISFLTSTRRDLPERHRSMTAVFDHSWSRLSETERGVLARLSVFGGGFTYEAAASVAGADLRTLLSLAQRSLLRFRGADRYGLHELVRQYAEAKLAERGEQAATRAAHGAWFLDLLAGALPGLGGADQPGALARLEADIDNVRAAWRWAVDARALAGHAEAIQALGLFYQMRSRFAEGADAYQEAIASLDGGPLDTGHGAALASALGQAGWFDLRLGRFDRSWSAFRRAAALIREQQLPYLDSQQSDPVLGLALFAYGRGDMHRCEELASGMLERALQAGRRANQYAALSLLGRLARYEGDTERALACHVRAHELALQAGDGWYRAQIVYELGMTAMSLNDRAGSRRYLEAALAAFDDPNLVTNALNGLGTLDLVEGKNEEAARRFTDVLARYRELRDEVGTIDALHGFNRAMTRLGAPTVAARAIAEGLQMAHAARMAPLTTTLLVDAAELFLSIGRARRAAELLGLAQTQPTWASRNHGDVERNLRAVVHQLAPEEQVEALNRGRALPLDAAIAETLAELIAIGSDGSAVERSRAGGHDLPGAAAPPVGGRALPSGTIHVLIVDDQEIMRAGLIRFLAGAGTVEVVGEARSGAEALRLAADLRPDVVLLDLLLPDMDGVEVARRLLAANEAVRILVLTSVVDQQHVRDAIQAGVIGYLSKDVRRGDLLRAIEDAAAGRPALHPDVQRFLMEQSTAPAAIAPLAALTGREREIMGFLARGYSNRAIAEALDLTHGTIKVYVSALLDKLGVSDRTQAALLAARYGLDAPERAAVPRPSGR